MAKTQPAPRRSKSQPTTVRVAAGSSWTLVPTPPRAVRSTRGSGAPEDNFDALIRELERTDKVKVHEDVEATSLPDPRRGGAPEPLPLEVPVKPGERYVVLVRHPSGALTVETPPPATSRGVATIQIQPRDSGGAGVRRGIGSFLRVVVFKVIGKLAGVALQKLAERWEESRFQKRSRGWVKVTAQGLLDARDGKSQLAKASPADFRQRNLLLLHGTLSTTEGAFAKLVGTKGPDGRDFFTWARTTYGDAIFGFDHKTISAPLEDNATEMLAGLPEREVHFDVVTHSRGGLVLRQLVERRGEYPNAGRFALDRAVLVAVPNEGTALASEKRWRDTVGWFANLLDLFPDNPFTHGISFVAEGLSWLAQAAVGRLKGLSAMDPADQEIAFLQDPPDPPAKAYSALVANFEPGPLAARLFDAGVDGFFAQANDLVVPSEGGWRAARQAVAIPGERIGCYGAGGNLGNASDVHHLNLFGQTATVPFLIAALSGQDAAAKPLDPQAALPFRGRFRGIAALPELQRLPAVPVPAPVVTGSVLPPSTSVRLSVRPRSGDALQLFVLGRNPSDPDDVPILIAGYRNARVVADFPIRGGEAGKAYRDIIGQQRRLRQFAEGLSNEAPMEPELLNLGASLFQQLFPARVRRLYDEVRSKNVGRRLDLILTSNIPWISDLPWEFSYDADRENFLALEEINFTRNVLTAIPADEIVPSTAPLRLLFSWSAPSNVPQLSTKEEIDMIASAFQAFRDTGLLEVEEIGHATPALLQRRLYEAALAGRPFDALHFIGHGKFDSEANEGVLLMEDEDGLGFPVDADSLRQILFRRGLRLVFLNACESSVGSLADFNRGLAPRLVEGGIPTVIANQYSVLDRAAVIFAHQFYLALAYGATVGDAAREARIAVNYSLPGGTMDWAVPVVFAQNPREALCEPPAEEVRRAVPAPTLPPLPVPSRALAPGPDVEPTTRSTLRRAKPSSPRPGPAKVPVSPARQRAAKAPARTKVARRRR